ncbi:MAG: hypothetical protein P8126_12770, partial [Gammaproteobacteria bacterium]
MHRSSSQISITCAALLALFLTGCAVTAPPHGPRESIGGGYAPCHRFFHALRRAVIEEQLGDAQDAPVTGYPYLRVSRFLASFRHRPMDGAMLKMWVERLLALGAQAWRVELTNLPPQRRAALAGLSPGGLPLKQAVGRCAGEMRAVDLATPQDVERLRRRVSVPDDYHTAWRVLGLYPVTGLMVSFGAARLHHEIHRTFSRPLARLQV